MTPSRDHVFHVNCPKEATTKTILDIFSPFGNVQIRWQDDNNLFVSLQDKDQAPLVMKNIEYDKPAFKVQPFAQYQTYQTSKLNKRPLENKQRQKGKNKNPKGPRQHSSASTSSTSSSGSVSDGGSVSPPLPDLAHHQKKRPKTDKPTGVNKSTKTGKSAVEVHVGTETAAKKKQLAASGLHFEEPPNWD